MARTRQHLWSAKLTCRLQAGLPTSAAGGLRRIRALALYRTFTGGFDPIANVRAPFWAKEEITYGLSVRTAAVDGRTARILQRGRCCRRRARAEPEGRRPSGPVLPGSDRSQTQAHRGPGSGRGVQES